MHDVVPIAVRNAVSAATITFTATSIILFFFILEFSFLTTDYTDIFFRTLIAVNYPLIIH